MGQGYEEGGEEYFSLDGGIFRKILSLTNHESNVAAVSEPQDQFASKSSVSFRPSVNSPYFDVVVKTIGKGPPALRSDT